MGSPPNMNNDRNTKLRFDFAFYKSNKYTTPVSYYIPKYQFGYLAHKSPPNGIQALVNIIQNTRSISTELDFKDVLEFTIDLRLYMNILNTV